VVGRRKHSVLMSVPPCCETSRLRRREIRRGVCLQQLGAPPGRRRFGEANGETPREPERIVVRPTECFDVAFCQAHPLPRCGRPESSQRNDRGNRCNDHRRTERNGSRLAERHAKHPVRGEQDREQEQKQRDLPRQPEPGSRSPRRLSDPPNNVGRDWKSDPQRDQSAERRELTEEEEATVARRLADLGYL